MWKRCILLRWWVIHGIITAVGHIWTSRAIRIGGAVGVALLVGVGGTLLVAIVVICVVGMVR